MKFFRKNVASGFIRLCRIQYDSTLQPQNLYPNHHYHIEFDFDEIYTPGSIGNAHKRIIDFYVSNSSKIMLTNINNVYVKYTETEDQKYVDIGVQTSNNYTNINLSVDSVVPGSVKFYCDSADSNEYTRQNYVGTNTNFLLFKGNTQFWVGANNSVNITVANRTTRITNTNTGDVSYVLSDGSVKHGDNTSHTITTSSATDYGRVVNIACKINNDLLIENI